MTSGRSNSDATSGKSASGDRQGGGAGNGSARDLAAEAPTVEHARLAEDAVRAKNWKRWGPYLPERQWATVREDYSADGNVWDYFPHDHARSRAYRWGEDGLLGWTDRECRLCVAPAIWNGRDPILKERLFGLTGPQGNHGEDVKELYYYLDSTPTHTYCRALYKYPQAAFPYDDLVAENGRRSHADPEYELFDTGVFDDDRYFDLLVEYAKGAPNDMLVRLTVTNRGPETATAHLLPTVWFRNTWRWGCTHEGCFMKPLLRSAASGRIVTWHETLDAFTGVFSDQPDGSPAHLLFTDNETNNARLFNAENPVPHVKDAFHRHVIHGETGAVNPKPFGTKVAAWYRLSLAPGESQTLSLRLFTEADAPAGEPLGDDFRATMQTRRDEADAFYAHRIPPTAGQRECEVTRQADAGLLWTKQFYHYVVADWLDGDANMPAPPEQRKHGRNGDWRHVYCRDVLSMPDKWEYPWFATWDLAFHMISFARLDPHYAKQTLLRLLREWYMHPNGQLPAYEFAFHDVNPPVHAYACWRLYKMSAEPGKRDTTFLARSFQKLLLNFTWWVNRKDPNDRNVFSGGFLGLDNIGVFDRSQPLPGGHTLTQSDGTAWMAFYCGTMLSMALELARTDPAYEDMASKFFEHYVAIIDAMNSLGGTGLWHEADGFYYDQLQIDGQPMPLRVRSLVGLMPLIAVEVLDQHTIDQLPGFKKRTEWFMRYRSDLAQHVSYMVTDPDQAGDNTADHHYLLAIPSKERLKRVLGYMLDENEFLSPFGIRSLSKVHEAHPYWIDLEGQRYEVRYEPGESQSGMFGGNSNWRGPIWMPVNFLLIEALERYDYFYGNELQVECPTGSGQYMRLREVARELERRLTALFLPASDGGRPCHGQHAGRDQIQGFEDLILFYEYFHAETGAGLGASHQTGWTALITHFIERRVRARGRAQATSR